MSWSVGGKPIDSILISRLRYLGDVVMSTIVLEVLRKGDPDLDIGYLCESAHGAVLANHPYLNRLHMLGIARKGSDARARSQGDSSSGLVGNGKGTLATIGQLRKTKYSAAVDLFFNPRSAWLLRFSGVPIRICGDAGSRKKLYTHSVIRKSFSQDNNPGHNEILRNVAPGGLGEHLCRLAPLHHDPSGLDFIDWLGRNFSAGSLQPRLGNAGLSLGGKAKLVSLGCNPGEPYLVAGPTATWQSKMMPMDLWVNTLNALAEATGLRILVVTTPDNWGKWMEKVKIFKPRQITILEPLDLPDVLGVVNGAQAMLSVDGGIMHASIGLGVPTVGLFGPTDPNMWFPYENLGPYKVLTTDPDCSPCHLHHCQNFICMPQLAVPDMVSAIQNVMKAPQ